MTQSDKIQDARDFAQQHADETFINNIQTALNKDGVFEATVQAPHVKNLCAARLFADRGYHVKLLKKYGETNAMLVTVSVVPTETR